MQWLGVQLEETFRNDCQYHTRELTARDRTLARNLLAGDIERQQQGLVPYHKETRQAFQHMLMLNSKIEIESLEGECTGTSLTRRVEELLHRKGCDIPKW